MSASSDHFHKITVRVSPDVHSRLAAVAEHSRGGMSAIVRDALAVHFGVPAKPLRLERTELANLGALPVGDAMRGEHLIEIIATSHGDNLAMAVVGLTNLAASYREIAGLDSLCVETRLRIARLAQAIDGAVAVGRLRLHTLSENYGEQNGQAC